MVEAFMSSWSSLVGDPVVSKWIVCFLAVSVVLNGYLLKGIAATAGLSSVVPGVRFSTAPQVKEVKEAKEEGDVSVKEVETKPESEKLTAIRKRHGSLSVAQADMKLLREKVREAQHQQEKAFVTKVVRPEPVRPAPATVNTLSLELVDRKLEQTQPRPQPDAPASDTPGSISLSPDSFTKDTLPEDVRSLEECIDIFENGPRPVSASLSLLNDEEVVMLAQDGKIQAYALEKMLGDYERAVKIRRALICVFLSTISFECILTGFAFQLSSCV